MKSGTRDTISPPAHLSERAAELWRACASSARSPGRRVLLQLACESLDRAAEAGQVIRAEGVMVLSKRSRLARPHPMLAVERAAKAEAVRLLRILGLVWDPLVDGALEPPA
jgi:phage terminase small subunit